jgi:hypothetical protein
MGLNKSSLFEIFSRDSKNLAVKKYSHIWKSCSYYLKKFKMFEENDHGVQKNSGFKIYSWVLVYKILKMFTNLNKCL